MSTRNFQCVFQIHRKRTPGVFLAKTQLGHIVANLQWRAKISYTDRKVKQIDIEKC